MKLNDVLIIAKATKVKTTTDVVCGTQTITETGRETTDKDPTSYNPLYFGTMTCTKTQREDTDADYHGMISLGTSTHTKVRSEDSDSDKNDTYNN